jgi:hypothetical protein
MVEWYICCYFTKIATYINKYLNFLMIINYSEINAENKIPKLLRTFIDGFKKIDIIIFFSYS